MGAKVTKRYDVPKTPYQRVLEAPEVADDVKARLRQLYETLNPAELLRQIQRRQAALWKLAIQPTGGTHSAGRMTAQRRGTQVPRTPPATAAHLNELASSGQGKVRPAFEATIRLG